jgi:lipid-A-disaccharide synthase
MIVAGEASGDKHGASLALALKHLNPEIEYELFGSGGEEMRTAGVETLVDARDVGIIGVPEIARAFARLYRAYRTLLSAARSRRPAAIVLIDWPDFNMRLARKLHREGFKVIYYISPQVWAWRKYRIRALRRDVDRMLVILPFEEEFYKRAGLEVRYVGHPLAESVRTTASREDFAGGTNSIRRVRSRSVAWKQAQRDSLPFAGDADAAVRLGLRIADCGLKVNELSIRINRTEIRNPQL